MFIYKKYENPFFLMFVSCICQCLHFVYIQDMMSKHLYKLWDYLMLFFLSNIYY